MPLPRRSRHRAPPARAVPAALVLAGAVLAGSGGWLASSTPARSEPPSGADVADVRVPASEPSKHQAAAPDRAAAQARPGDLPPATPPPPPVVVRPAEVVIEAIDLRADLVALGLDDQGALEVPSDFGTAGWWRGGPAPGEPGPAVLVGHVDSYRGPAVFWRLAELEPGDVVTVRGDDGTSRDFVVDGVGRWPKSQFPTDAVYRQADGAELRLITCGGAFDERTRSYRDNVVVFASAV